MPSQDTTIRLTPEQRDLLLALIDTTDYDESYYRDLGWDLRDGLLRETYEAVAR